MRALNTTIELSEELVRMRKKAFAEGMATSTEVVDAETLLSKTKVARLAAYYSSGREQQKLEVDYLQKKNVKKPGGSKPGFVVYYTNYSMMIDTDISSIRKAD